jgi:hypothetical protein
MSVLSQCDQQWVDAAQDLKKLGLNVPKLEKLAKRGFGAFEELAAVAKLAQPAHPEKPWSKPCQRVVTALKAWITLVDQGGDADGAKAAWDGLVSVARAVLVERAEWRAIFAASAKIRADSAKKLAYAEYNRRLTREAWSVANQYRTAYEQVAEQAAQVAKLADKAEQAKQAVLAASRVTDAAKAAHDAHVAQRAADDAVSLIRED